MIFVPRPVEVSPLKTKLSSYPKAVIASMQAAHDPLKTHPIGYHEHADKLIADELKDAIELNVEGLNELLFPDSAFPESMPLDKLFDCMNEMSPTPLYDPKKQEWLNAPQFSVAHQELPIALFLDGLGNLGREVFKAHNIRIPEVRRWSANFRDTIFPAGILHRKPDIVNVVSGEEKSWNTSGADLQHKSNISSADAATTQLHDGGMNSLTSQDDRDYHVGIAITGQKMFTTYYDRSGCLQSEAIDIHAEPLLFLRVVLGLTLLDKRYLGYDPTIRVDEHGSRFVTVENKEYKIMERLDKQPGITGLGTVCWLCWPTASADPDVRVVIKSSWIDRSRKYTEDVYLQHARDNEISGVPKLVAYEVLALGGKPISTESLRKRLPGAKELSPYEVRDHARLVEEGHGVPLHCFASKSELLFAIRDAVATHQNLHDNAKILHSDISDKNIVLNSANPSGSRKGLLIDFNYAQFVRDPHDQTQVSAKGHRSCPTFFVACDLLNFGEIYKPAYYYDLESFVYVLINMGVCYAGPNGTLREGFSLLESELGLWMDDNKRVAGSVKQVTMSLRAQDDPFRRFLEENFHPYFEDIKPCVLELRQLVMRQDTRCTYKEFIEILTRHADALRLTELTAPPALAQVPVSTDSHSGQVAQVLAVPSSQPPTEVSDDDELYQCHFWRAKGICHPCNGSASHYGYIPPARDFHSERTSSDSTGPRQAYHTAFSQAVRRKCVCSAFGGI
ncbi:hypothetical protein BD626DRAFT_635813 [Schizophyllum amplum]|uniref:Protein kinase domain-containing protein n=1 Tax=Schizophyllum amplum TaxID=97359 RepID=A0A550BV87_9AGAR|nr:hypothetical protein BD626DRAFT_635813 [Auriculariopsis ampla]